MASEELVEFIKSWEQLKLRSSEDRVARGKYDIGYGHLIDPKDHPMVITKEQAHEMLMEDIAYIEDKIDSLVTVFITRNERDALITFAYNVGVGHKDRDDPTKDIGFAGSTLLERLNEGDYNGAADEFKRWNRSQGRVILGLTKRRAAEEDMFRYADYSGRP